MAKEKKPDAREDWLIRFVAISDLPNTNDVLVARQVIDSGETKTKLLTSLKKLERNGWVKSQKVGRELAWTATKAGEEVMA
jgi:predicted MarR family transcription regulator